MRLLERIRKLEAATNQIDGIALCGDAYTIIKAWENSEPFESLASVSVQSLKEWGTPNAEAWDAARAASIADYDKTFGAGAYAKNRADQKEWQAAAAAKAGTQ